MANGHAIGALRSRSLFQIALQYVLSHRALEGRLPIGIGLHAVNGALLLIVATFLAIGCTGRKMSA
jgi:hypothetical protein